MSLSLLLTPLVDHPSGRADLMIVDIDAAESDQIIIAIRTGVMCQCGNNCCNSRIDMLGSCISENGERLAYNRLHHIDPFVISQHHLFRHFRGRRVNR